MRRMIQTIKELFTAHYDIDTNEIKCCRKGGLAYFHEDRHREQMENKLIYWINYINYFFGLVLSMFFISFGFINNVAKGGFLLAGICMTPHFISVFLLEVDAWVFSLIRYSTRTEGR